MSKPRVKRKHVFWLFGDYWIWECANETGDGSGSTPREAYDNWVLDMPKGWVSWAWRKVLKKIGWR